MKNLVVTALLTAGLMGCTSVTEGRYKTVQTVLETSEGRDRLVERCIEKMKKMSIQARRDMAAITRSSLESAPSVGCKRVTVAIASGRLSQKELANMSNPAADHSNLIRVLQGR